MDNLVSMFDHVVAWDSISAFVKEIFAIRFSPWVLDLWWSSAIAFKEVFKAVKEVDLIRYGNMHNSLADFFNF